MTPTLKEAYIKAVTKERQLEERITRRIEDIMDKLTSDLISDQRWAYYAVELNTLKWVLGENMPEHMREAVDSVIKAVDQTSGVLKDRSIEPYAPRQEILHSNRQVVYKEAGSDVLHIKNI